MCVLRSNCLWHLPCIRYVKCTVPQKLRSYMQHHDMCAVAGRPYLPFAFGRVRTDAAKCRWKYPLCPLEGGGNARPRLVFQRILHRLRCNASRQHPGACACTHGVSHVCGVPAQLCSRVRVCVCLCVWLRVWLRVWLCVCGCVCMYVWQGQRALPWIVLRSWELVTGLGLVYVPSLAWSCRLPAWRGVLDRRVPDRRMRVRVHA